MIRCCSSPSTSRSTPPPCWRRSPSWPAASRLPSRQATPEEIAADGAVSNLVKNTPEGRWVAFRAEEELPADTTVTVNIGPGTPSAEGPLITEQVQSFSFTTYAALRIVDSYCWYGGGPCPPGSPFTIRFNNPLDAQGVRAEHGDGGTRHPGHAGLGQLRYSAGVGRHPGADDLPGHRQRRHPGHVWPDAGRRPDAHLPDGGCPGLPDRPQPAVDDARSVDAKFQRLLDQLSGRARACLCRHARRLAGLSPVLERVLLEPAAHPAGQGSAQHRHRNPEPARHADRDEHRSQPRLRRQAGPGHRPDRRAALRCCRPSCPHCWARGSPRCSRPGSSPPTSAWTPSWTRRQWSHGRRRWQMARRWPT